MLLRCFCVILFAFCLNNVLADNSRDNSRDNFLIQLDNDLFFNNDKDYTSGVRIAQIREFERTPKALNRVQNLLQPMTGAKSDSSFNQFRLSGKEAIRYSWGTGITQLMFTPKDYDASTPLPGERPYAGWLGLEFSLHAKTERCASSVTMTLGTTGKNSLAQGTQDWVHRNISKSQTFKGWDSQVPSEITLNFFFDHKKRLMKEAMMRDSLIELDGYSEWGAALGNFKTNAYVGGMIRAGYNLKSSYSIPRVQVGSYGHELFEKADPNRGPFSIYGFFGGRAAAVLHDITLNGPVFQNYEHTVKTKPLVGELVTGCGISWNQLELSLSRTFRTREFKSQNNSHSFGSVLLRFILPF
jgi:hypothetical protein